MSVYRYIVCIEGFHYKFEVFGRNAMNKLILLTLCLFYAGSALSAEKAHKDWVIDTDGSEYFYAATLNNSGHVFGKYCYFESENCMYITGVDIKCTNGNKYPALVNSDSGSMNTTLHCGGRVEGQNVLIFENFDDIEATVKKSKQLGIAIPMENGKFKVSRFSMSGSTYSIDKMTKEAEKHLALSNADSELL
ncbi:hypothetical protein VHA01S_027_00350 [Vibrio halioticoli NBRC 102217]|uniref:Uncharacterized protein n=2 Tax=Vibrio halioticoli TaxID=71388 RepID=V5F3M4_9VIBR|nr:hypothetical protein VHA01S_027_00350 [Vibrio halioticoli NBRC 102217]